jgi:dihydrofolate reductase
VRCSPPVPPSTRSNRRGATALHYACDPRPSSRTWDPAADRDLTVGGAHLAGQAIAVGLVDEYQLFVVPAVVGGGTRALPGRVRLNLALAQEHKFGSGTVYLCYRQA